MAVYKHPAWIYFNDVEFFELMSNVGHRELLKSARSKGFVYSDKSENEFVRSSLSLLPSNWHQISHIFSLVERPDPAERTAFTKLRECGPENDLHSISRAVGDYRHSKNKDEDYVITQVSPDYIKVKVTYIETDLSKAIQYSRRERSLDIIIKRNGDEIAINYDANEKAKQIVKEIQKLIKPKPTTLVKEQIISLNSIRDPALRTKFFTELLKTIEGYSFVSSSNAVVDCRISAPETSQDAVPEDEIEDNGTANKTAEDIKSTINRIALTGDQVLANELYQQAANTGYFITQLNWTVESKSEPGVYADLVAGFSDPITCEQFSSDVCRRWKHSVDNPNKIEVIQSDPNQRQLLNELIQNGASSAMTTVAEEQSKASKSKSK